MKKKLIFSLAVLGFVSGGAFNASAKKTEEFPVCQYRPIVAVGEFTTENLFMGNREAAINMRDELVNQLVNSGCYKVVERGRQGIVSSGYDREQGIKAVGASRKGQKGARSGQVTLAEKILTCALTSVSKDNTGGGISGLGGGLGGFGGGGVNVKSSKIEMTCRIYDSSTSEIIASATNSKSKVDTGVAAGGGSRTMGLGANFYTGNPLGKVIRSLIRQNIIDITKTVQKNPWG